MATVGRDLRIKHSTDGGTTYTAIAGARSDSITFGNERIECNDKDDDGVMTAIDDVATKSCTLSCSGVMKNNTLATLAANATAGTALPDFQVDVGTLMVATGKWFIDSFEMTGEDTDAITFSMSMSSSGAVVIT